MDIRKTIVDSADKNSESDVSDAAVVEANVEALNCVKSALSKSRLLEHLVHFRESSLLVESVNKELSADELESRAQAMVVLKSASELFNSLLSPASQDQKFVLHKLRLDQLLSAEYWHTLFLANALPGQGRLELDWLCSTLFNALQLPPSNGVDQVNPNSNVEGRSKKTVLSPLHDTDQSANTNSEPVNQANTNSEPLSQVNTTFGVFSGFIAGMSALLLLVLAVNVFPFEFSAYIQRVLPIGSIPYRLLMILVLLTLTTSCFFMLSRQRVAECNDTTPIVSAHQSRGMFARLFDIGASPRRVIAGAVGPAFLGLGLGISISAGFGTFGFSVLLDGIYQTFQVPFWISQTVITIGCYLLAWLWGRVPFGLGTITTLLLIGPAISFGAGLPPDNLGFIGDLLAFIIGLLLFAGGISLAAAAALGPDGVTALSLAAERTHKWPVSRATFLWDITAIVAGMILGGNFGVATLIGLLTVPYLIHLFIPPLRRLLH